MRHTGLITKPDGPVAGFVQGATATAFAVGIPLSVKLLIFAMLARQPLLGVALSAGLTATASLIAGIALAIWRQIQCWAYDRFLEGPPR